MIAKSWEEKEHVGNLKKLFERLRKFQLKLNPAKCTFGATSGKLLGFIISEKGIEVDPEKIKAIQELPPPHRQKETSAGATPFSLVYGMKAVLPVEMEIPSLRILMESKLEESEWVQARYDQLNLIEGKCLKAICHGQMYQKRMIMTHDKKLRPREFREGIRRRGSDSH
ncbi:uncharacterized protein [Gossypium hirsutum]|uniref:RNA-directed DNA polymerase homolog n=1 Tax=Gossypium hirsutum TaxID=3635 RepID=A0ABM3A1C9_GOSHI|nr:uncharacterized protein LOC121217210 [Gossypium hirsutum]